MISTNNMNAVTGTMTFIPTNPSYISNGGIYIYRCIADSQHTIDQTGTITVQ